MPKTISLPMLTALILSVSLSGTVRADSHPKPVFLKAFYPLDEPRFHCVDIPGHKARVNTGRPLSVHTCKEGIWHNDELFDAAAIRKGDLRMPLYDLCVEAAGLEDGAALLLKPCAANNLQTWEFKNYRLRLKNNPGKCLTIGAETSALTPGGRRHPSKHMARSLALADCADTAFQRQMWRFELPQDRTGSVMPFGG